MENIKDLPKKLPSLFAILTLSAGIIATAIGAVQYPAVPNHLTLVNALVVFAMLIGGIGIGVVLSKDGEEHPVHFTCDFLGVELLAVAIAIIGKLTHKPLCAFLFTSLFVTIAFGVILRRLITAK